MVDYGSECVKSHAFDTVPVTVHVQQTSAQASSISHSHTQRPTIYGSDLITG